MVLSSLGATDYNSSLTFGSTLVTVSGGLTGGGGGGGTGGGGSFTLPTSLLNMVQITLTGSELTNKFVVKDNSGTPIEVFKVDTLGKNIYLAGATTIKHDGETRVEKSNGSLLFFIDHSTNNLTSYATTNLFTGASQFADTVSIGNRLTLSNNSTLLINGTSDSTEKLVITTASVGPPATEVFRVDTVNQKVIINGLTASQVVVTDASKQLSSLAYSSSNGGSGGSADVANMIVQRDTSGFIRTRDIFSTGHMTVEAANTSALNLNLKAGNRVIINAGNFTGGGDGQIHLIGNGDCLIQHNGLTRFQFGGNVRFRINHASNYVESTHLYPLANNTYNLGSDTARWTNLYATTLRTDTLTSLGGDITIKTDGGTTDEIILQSADAIRFWDMSNSEYFRINISPTDGSVVVTRPLYTDSTTNSGNLTLQGTTSTSKLIILNNDPSPLTVFRVDTTNQIVYANGTLNFNGKLITFDDSNPNNTIGTVNLGHPGPMRLRFRTGGGNGTVGSPALDAGIDFGRYDNSHFFLTQRPSRLSISYSSENHIDPTFPDDDGFDTLGGKEYLSISTGGSIKIGSTNLADKFEVNTDSGNYVLRVDTLIGEVRVRDIVPRDGSQIYNLGKSTQRFNTLYSIYGDFAGDYSSANGYALSLRTTATTGTLGCYVNFNISSGTQSGYFGLNSGGNFILNKSLLPFTVNSGLTLGTSGNRWDAYISNLDATSFTTSLINSNGLVVTAPDSVNDEILTIRNLGTTASSACTMVFESRNGTHRSKITVGGTGPGFNFDSSVYPTTTNLDLGLDPLRWNNVYCNNLFATNPIYEYLVTEFVGTYVRTALGNNQTLGLQFTLTDLGVKNFSTINAYTRSLTQTGRTNQRYMMTLSFIHLSTVTVYGVSIRTYRNGIFYNDIPFNTNTIHSTTTFSFAIELSTNDQFNFFITNLSGQLMNFTIEKFTLIVRHIDI